MIRRSFFKFGIGVAALGGLAYWQRNPLLRFLLTRMPNNVTATIAPEAGADVCVLTPEQTSGPYFVKAPLRTNITEEQPGLPLTLDVEVVQMPDCTPLEGVTVEIWQCNAQGYYSGYADVSVRAPFDTLASIAMDSEAGSIPPRDSETFMRGGQVSDGSGVVQFETIFPGWYDPRLTHIHLKVSRDGETFLTTQLYFPDELVDDIYTNHPDYLDYGTCPYNLTTDSVLRELGDQTGVILNTTRTEEQLTASARFGIA